MTNCSEIYLVLRTLTSTFPHFANQLSALSLPGSAQCFAGVDVMYERESDMALLCIRFQRSTPSQRILALIQVATAAGIPVMNPEKLNERDQNAFYRRYLRRFDLRINDKHIPSAALGELADLLGIAYRPQEFDAQQENMATKVESFPRHELLGSQGGARAKTTAATKRAMGTNSERRSGPPPIPTSARANKKVRPKSDEEDTVGPVRRARASSIQITTPITLEGDPSAGAVTVEYQRGDAWAQARLRNLTVDELRLAVGATPALGSTLRISIAIGGVGAIVNGTVVQLVETERSKDGSSTIRVKLNHADNTQRERLIELLRKAKREGLSLSPPPSRANQRFNLSWPVTIVADNHQFQAEAIDVSTRGFFVTTSRKIRSKQISFSLKLDGPHPVLVSGRATVAREVSARMALARGLSRGYGVCLDTLEPQSQAHYEQFLARVQRRSQQHILVLGGNQRTRELANILQGAGYVVSNASSTESLQQWRGGQRKWPDIAVAGSGYFSPNLRREFSDLLRANAVPMLTLEEAQVGQSARQALDEVLLRS